MKNIPILVFAAALSVAAVLGVNLALGSSPAQTQKTYGPGWVNWAHLGATQPIAQALSGIEGNVGVVYYLSPDTGAWLRYVPAKPELSTLTTMEFGRSYLMLLTAPTAMTIPTEATFLATPAASLQSELCTSYRMGIELNTILLEIAEQGKLVGATAEEVRDRLEKNQRSFDQQCGGVPVLQATFVTGSCAVAGKWLGIQETTLLYAPSAQDLVWGNQFRNIVNKYCIP